MDVLVKKIAGIEKLLTPEQVAEIFGIKVETLNQWRHKKRYDLNFVKIGRCVRYRRSDVEDFIKTRMTTDL